MNIEDFKRVITSFADKPTDLQMDKGRLLTEIRGELIEASVILRDGNLFVVEKGVEDSAYSWLRNRIAGLPQLAERIIDYIPLETAFIDPCSELLDELEFDPNEQEKRIEYTTETLIDILNRKVPGTTSILYLTSDAGDGKSTLINTAAHLQAKRFKEKKSDWLLLPIPLGGGPFLRMDDIVIASIINKLRFRYFYFDSFIELVRLGMVVPALDGFEEMFMQNSAGEALSATGNLVNKLNSGGSLLIAARKAYFDYKSFSSQAKLFDTITASVSFARMSLQRWNKEQFVLYTSYQGVSNPDQIYDLVVNKLHNPHHPILTRPVLIKQLIGVFSDSTNVNDLISQLESATSYFPAFVNVIIEREANIKWIDTSGEPFKPILTVDQHYQLLSYLAEEMWLNSNDTLKDSILDLISELFADQNRLTIQTARQIKERIKQHALIIRSDPNSPSYKFDHDEFREYFLGVAIADKIILKRTLESRELLKKLQLPTQTFEAIVARVKSSKKDIEGLKVILDEIIKGEGQTSFVRENVGGILIRLLNNVSTTHLSISNYEFSSNSFFTIKLDRVTFENCHFQNTSLKDSVISNCMFSNCNFDRLELSNTVAFKEVTLKDCHIASLHDIAKDKAYYDEFSIKRILQNKGVIIVDGANGLVFPDGIVEDEDLELVERALRRFVRSNNPINDSIFKLRLGNKADHFISKILPELIRREILIEVDYVGSGQKRRFKLGVSFSKIDKALSASKGKYEGFLSHF